MDEAIMDRIAKLMAKANGTENENEAAIFAAKAAEMLAEHNLTEAMIKARQAGTADPVNSDRYPNRAPDVWRTRILQGCARLYFCSMINHVGESRPFEFFGREANRMVAFHMADYLIATVKRMAREYSPTKAEQSDFRRGAGDRLYERLFDMWKAANEQPVPLFSGNRNVPALYRTEVLAVQDAVKAAYPEGLSKGRARKHSYKGDGALAGRAAADRIGLNKQVAESRPNRMIGGR